MDHPERHHPEWSIGSGLIQNGASGLESSGQEHPERPSIDELIRQVPKHLAVISVMDNHKKKQ